MRYVIVDLEASCWEQNMPRDAMEIIEIGAVLLASSTGPSIGDFASFVRPVAHRQLSDFCTRLTGIRQEDVDSADPFSMEFRKFEEWIGAEPFWLCSWGGYDLNQFQTDCRRHNMELPASFQRHINLKKEFSKLQRTKPLGMKAALARMGIPLEGQHHRGHDDAVNIAKLAVGILPALEQSGAPYR